MKTKEVKAAKGVVLRKRSQIAKANRTMFLWVAGSSVILGFAVVTMIYLAKMMMFNEKVLKEKDKTISILRKNNDNIPKLQSQIRVLDTNETLSALKSNPDDNAIQVILDALPSEANSLALGASIQNKILGSVNNITQNALQVDQVMGIESLMNFNSVENASPSSSAASEGEITFRFSISGQRSDLKKVLENMEKSIRAFDITTLKIESQGDQQGISVQAKSYYESERVVELTEKTVR